MSKLIKKIQDYTTALHNHFFCEVYSETKYALDLFRLILASWEFDLFDWSTLRSQATVFLKETFKERRADLIFSVKMKNSNVIANIIFIFEHKSYNDPLFFLQLLEYQLEIYTLSQKRQTPCIIIPVLVYAGGTPWRFPLSFHEYLNLKDPQLKKAFGENILNYKYRLLNLNSLDMEGLRLNNLPSGMILFILKNIWNLDKRVVGDLFEMSKEVSNEQERRFLIEKVADYIRLYDSKFTWEVLQDIESQYIPERRRVMPPLQFALDEAMQKGIEKGRQEGIEKGQQTIVLKLLQANMDIQEICKITGLSVEEINKLSKK